MSDFEVHIEGDARVVVSGELDMATAPQMSSAIGSLTETPSKRVLVDLTSVTFIDSTGIAALVRAAAKLDELGVLLVLGPISTYVTSVFRVAGLENHFTRDEHP